MTNDTERSPGRLRRSAVAIGFAGLLVVAGGVANAGHATGHFRFNERIPRFGSATFPKQYNTTTAYLDINIQYDENPYSLSVKPVRCSNNADISGYKSVAANDHTWKVIASSVLNGTCYKLNMDAGTTNYFDVWGDIHS